MKEKLNKQIVKFVALLRRKPYHFGTVALVVIIGALLTLIFVYFGNNSKALALSVPTSIPDNCSVDNSYGGNPGNDLEDWLDTVPAGSVVNFPTDACYLIQRSLVLQQLGNGQGNITLNGNGTTLERTSQAELSNSIPVGPMLDLLQNTNLTIENLNINGGYDNVNYGGPAFENQYGIRLESNNGVMLNAVNISNVEGDGMTVQFDPGTIQTNGSNRINTNVSYINSTINNTGYHGIVVEAVDGLNIENDRINYAAVDAMDFEYDKYQTGEGPGGMPYPAAEDDVNVINNKWNQDGYNWFSNIQGQGVQEDNVVLSGNTIGSYEPVGQVSAAPTASTLSFRWNEGLFIQNNKFSGNAVAQSTGEGGGTSPPKTTSLQIVNVNDVNISNNSFPQYDETDDHPPYIPTFAAMDDNDITGKNFNSNQEDGLSLVDNNFTGAYSDFLYTPSGKVTADCGNLIGANSMGVSPGVDSNCGSPAPACPVGEVGDVGSCYYPTPNAPSTVTATATGPDSINVTWSQATDSSNTVAGYYILRSEEGQNPLVIGQTNSPTATSFVDDTVSGNTTYSYEIEAYDSGNSNNSFIPPNISSPTTDSLDPTTPNWATQPPSVPTNVAATVTSPVKVTVSWNSSTDSHGTVGGYYILRNNQIIGSVVAGVTSYVDNTIQPGKSYSYTVEAYDTNNPADYCQASTTANSDGCAASSYASITTPYSPTIPQGFNATAAPGSTTEINLYWRASSNSAGNGIGGYYLYSSPSNTLIATLAKSNCNGNGGCNYTVTGLTPNTSYSYYLTAFDTSTPANESLPSQVSGDTTNSGADDCTPPTAPTGVSIDNITDSSFRVSWTDSTMPTQTDPACNQFSVAGYRVYDDSTGTPVLLDNDPDGTDTKDTVSNNIDASTTYSVYVVAYDSNTPKDLSADSTPDVPVTTTAPQNNPPTIPNGLTVTQDANFRTGQLDISWDASNCKVANMCTGILGYDVYRIGSSGNPVLLGAGDTSTDTPTVGAADTSFDDDGNNGNGLDAGTTYKYYVVAIDESTPPLYSAKTANVSGTTANKTYPDPIAPVLSVTANTYNEVDLSWTASTDTGGPGVGGYNIYRSVNSGNPNLIFSVGATVKTLADVNVHSDTEYTYYVQAVDQAVPPDYSANSNTQDITTPDGPGTPAPDAPTNVSVNAITDSTATINWVASVVPPGGNGIGGYYVFNDGNLVDTVNSSTATSDNLTDLAPGTSYDITVAAFDNSLPALVSNQSNLVDFTTLNLPQPTAPANPTVTATTFNSISLSWSPSTESGGTVAGYAIYENGDATPDATTTSTSYTFTALPSNTSYSFVIEAYDNASPAVYSLPTSTINTNTNLIGDIDGDSLVTAHDLSILLSHYNTNYLPGEFDLNNLIDEQDINTWITNSEQ